MSIVLPKCVFWRTFNLSLMSAILGSNCFVQRIYLCIMSWLYFCQLLCEKINTGRISLRISFTIDHTHLSCVREDKLRGIFPNLYNTGEVGVEECVCLLILYLGNAALFSDMVLWICVFGFDTVGTLLGIGEVIVIFVPLTVVSVLDVVKELCCSWWRDIEALPDDLYSGDFSMISGDSVVHRRHFGRRFAWLGCGRCEISTFGLLSLSSHVLTVSLV